MKFIAPVTLFLVLVTVLYGTKEVYPVAQQKQDVGRIKQQMKSK